MYRQTFKTRNYNYTAKQMQLINTLRKLWEQHVMWTRSFIISTAADLGDLNLVTKRLLQNPVDFENLLKQFYGSKKADEFKTLFQQHLLIAAQLVNAAKAGNTEEVELQRRDWYSNADEIATYLSKVNPYWNKNEWQKMLYEHLSLTENEAIARLAGQYTADMAWYELIENEALKMADMMSTGLAKQFKLQ